MAEVTEQFWVQFGAETAAFDRSTRGMNTVLKSLRIEAAAFDKALRVDPQNLDILQGKFKNLQEQLRVSDLRAQDLKEELAQLKQIDPASPRIAFLANQIRHAEADSMSLRSQMQSLGKDINGVGLASQSFNVLKSVGSAAFSALAGTAKAALSGIVSLAQSVFSAVASAAKGAFDAVASTAAASGAAIAGVLGTALTKGFGRLTAIDTAQAKMRGLGKTTDEISGIMQSASNSVKGTAFSLDEAANIASRALASGIKPGKDLDRTLKVVANSAAAAGGDMQETGRILTQVAALNKAYTADLNQMADRGIDAWGGLEKATGKSREELTKLVSTGKIDFATFQEAIEIATGSIAKEMGTTLPGTIRNLNASLGRIGANFLTGIYPKLAPAFAGVTQALGGIETIAQQVGEALGAKLGPVFDKITHSFSVMTLSVSGIKDLMSQLPSWVGPAAAAFATLASGGIASLVGSLPVVGGLFGGLLGPLAQLATPLGAITTAFGALLFQDPALRASLGGLKDGFMGLVRGGDAGKEALNNFINDLVNRIQVVLPEIAGSIANIIPAIVSSLIQAINLIAQMIPQILPSLVSAVLTIVTTLAAAIPPLIPVLANAFMTLFTSIVAEVPNILSQLLPMIPAIVNGLLDSIISMIPVLTNAFVDLMTAVMDSLPMIVDTIVQAVPKIVDGLVEFFSNSVPKIVDAGIKLLVALVEALPTIITSIVQQLPRLITSIVNAILDNITVLAQAGVTLFIALIKALPEIIVEIVKSIPSIITGIVDAFMRAIPQMIQTGINLIGSLFDGIMGSIGNLFGGLWNAITGAIGGGQMLEPQMAMASGYNPAGMMTSTINNYGSSTVLNVNVTANGPGSMQISNAVIDAIETRLVRKVVR